MLEWKVQLCFKNTVQTWRIFQSHTLELHPPPVPGTHLLVVHWHPDISSECQQALPKMWGSRDTFFQGLIHSALIRPSFMTNQERKSIFLVQWCRQLVRHLFPAAAVEPTFGVWTGHFKFGMLVFQMWVSSEIASNLKCYMFTFLVRSEVW